MLHWTFLFYGKSEVRGQQRKSFGQGLQNEQIGGITDPSAVQSAIQGVDAVIHLAALLHIVNPSPAMREKYERVNVGGTATVIEAAIKAGVKRVVLFSRTGCLACERRRRSTFSLLLTWFTNMLTWQT